MREDRRDIPAPGARDCGIVAPGALVHYSFEPPEENLDHHSLVRHSPGYNHLGPPNK